MAAHDGRYQVFISYKKGHLGSVIFTSFLHHALENEKIKVSMDRESLPSGQPMIRKLNQTIRNSKILIPVISEGYVGSEWCLKELAEMVKCYESKGQIILPIFFNVKPKDVKKHKGIVEASFKVHKAEEQILMRWKIALKLVGGMAGQKLQDDGDNKKVVESVVKRVLAESSCFANVECPVKLSTYVEEIDKLLCSDGVASVGIYGERGIGKTTIAQALFERYSIEFVKTCFLENIGEEASKGETSKGKSSNGLQNLQKQLIESISKKKADVFISDVAKGKKLIQESLEGERVLIILDGVDSEDQFKAFAIEFNSCDSGSKIIITSREKKILKSFKAAKIYSSKKLDKRQSLELFSWHAFSKKQPPEDHSKVCKDVVKLAKGLPLNLVELAAFLTNGNEKDKQVWEARLEELKKITGSDLHQRIKKWYDKYGK